MKIIPDPPVKLLQVGDDEGAAFVVASPVDGKVLRIISSWGGGWDHVSVSRVDRIPLWEEMDYVKRLFFKDDEIAIQFHVPPSKHINIHPHVLHLWRNQKEPITLPDPIFV